MTAAFEMSDHDLLLMNVDETFFFMDEEVFTVSNWGKKVSLISNISIHADDPLQKKS